MDLPIGSQGLRDGVLQTRLSAHYKRLCEDFEQEPLPTSIRKDVDVGAIAVIFQKLFSPRDIRNEPQIDYDDRQVVKKMLDWIAKAQMMSRCLDLIIEAVQTRFVLIKSEIITQVKLYKETSDLGHLRKLIYDLVDWRNAWAPPAELGQAFSSRFNLEFRNQLYSSLPLEFPSCFVDLCKDGLGKEPDSQLFTNLDTLGFLDLYENLLTGICYEEISRWIHENCPGEWGETYIPKIREWLIHSVVLWMYGPWARGTRTVEDGKTVFRTIGIRFEFYAFQVLCELRISEMFDIIKSYPDCEGVLMDLKECLFRTGERNTFVQSLRQQIQKRLLHPGADTEIILSQYVSMIRCLRFIDPPGVLLHKVAGPVRKYLRERPDTIRSIVAGLVGESNDLVDENEPIQPIQNQYEDYTDRNWLPEAIDASPDFRTNKPGDIVSTLVSIYDSRDLFVKELQTLLAQRLLAVKDGNYEKERHNIEVLKIRFGDAALQVCEVMLKDMTDSRRIDQRVQSQEASVLHPTIISKQFWPPLQSSSLVMPGQLRSIQESYGKEFITFKPDKRLRWLSHLGSVELSLELSDRTLEVEVSPLEAAVIELFSEQGTWTIADLMERLGRLDRTTVSRALATWVGHEAIKAVDKDTYILLETADDSTGDEPKTAPGRNIISEEAPDAMIVTVQQQEEDQMRIYWKFIEGMLTNLGALPLDRIQTMLKFAPGYNKTPDQLTAFMEAARREQQVIFSGGLWRLNKS